MADVRLHDVSRVHADGTRAVSHLDLSVASGRRLAIVGPSGSGKTTVLRVIAGLDPVDGGHVEIDGVIVDDLSPAERDVALVFQSAALYPHLDVAGNLEFPLRVHGAPPDAHERVAAEARALGLARLLRRKPRTLSAGHRQRVALGRATARLPRVLCLDEPLSDVDARERERLRREIVRLQQGFGFTLLHVTNDRTEALALGERVAVLRSGRLEQIDEPTVLHAAPASPFVAAFIGEAALLRATVEREGDAWWLLLGRHRLRFAGTPPLAPLAAGMPVAVGLRPDHLVDARAAARYPHDRRLHAAVVAVEHLGAELRVHVALDATPVTVAGEPAAPRAGRASAVARMPVGSEVRVGDRVELAVDLRGAHVFDLATGRSLRR